LADKIDPTVLLGTDEGSGIERNQTNGVGGGDNFLLKLKTAVFILLTFLAVIIFLTLLKRNKMNPHKLMFSITKPSSFDPVSHDLFVHHITQRAVTATLVTQYYAGSFIPVAAESWKVSEDRTEWVFQMRKNFFFENGEPINAEAVELSLRRMAYLMKKSHSKSGVFEFVEGFENIKNLQGKISGLILNTEAQTVTIKLIKPVEKFLDKLSFGLYGIVSKSDFSETTGEWKNKKQINSSGLYKVKNWSEKFIEVEKKQDFPKNIFFENSFNNVLFSWDQNKKADVYMRSELDPPEGEGYEFFGGARNGIWYVRLTGAHLKQSPFFEKETRQKLMKTFYENLSKINFKPTYSFLPLAINGVKEVSNILKVLEKKEMCQTNTKETGKARVLIPLVQTGQRFKIRTILKETIETCGFEVEDISVNAGRLSEAISKTASDVPFDAGFLITGILIEKPIDDMRFMIESAHGIQLPDASGKLTKLVAQEEFSAQEFNELVSEDATIWPVTHVGNGLWYNPKVLSLEKINRNLPPTELGFIEAL
jgi:hypothetical protein